MSEQVLSRMELEEKMKDWPEPSQFMMRELLRMKDRCPACTDTQAKQAIQITHNSQRLTVIEESLRVSKAGLAGITGGTAVGGGVVALIGQYALQKLFGG